MLLMVPFDEALNGTRQWERPAEDVYDHIWAYSFTDFRNRLAPFSFEEITPNEALTANERSLFAVCKKEVLYVCRKPASSSSPVAEPVEINAEREPAHTDVMLLGRAQELLQG